MNRLSFDDIKLCCKYNVVFLSDKQHIGHCGLSSDTRYKIRKFYKRKIRFVRISEKYRNAILQKYLIKYSTCIPENFCTAQNPKYKNIILFVIILLICYLANFFGNVGVYLLNLIYFLYYTMKFITIFACHKSTHNKNSSKIEKYPVYSIIIPLYKESHMVHSILNSVYSLEYPKNMLDVLVVLEEDDAETIEVVTQYQSERHFRSIIVPNSIPRTKSKACKYALPFVKGELLTIYDAEDIPEKDQLIKVSEVFMNNKDLFCVQCRLNFYNKEHNLLTKLLSIEYKIHFDFFLQSLANLALIVPLGGTSNHFNVHMLTQQNNWDPYNVTEDADIAVRYYKPRYITISNSYTYEESVYSLHAWIKQRSRWIKGFLQTFCTHSKEILQENDIKKQISFLMLFGIPNLIILTSPFVLFHNILYGYNSLYTAMNLLCFYITEVVLVIFVHKNLRNILIYLLYPVYLTFFLPVASYVALYSLYRNPYYWSKTEHTGKR
ncbi:MAG: hypothetical protein P857_334 [Candidatus Xenolissoclinum pacificiensis L6]|uniref:Uncharacterized protein n=1 Tax=Candidatus Xenolissoclinum pacificiensis L6 TaxID=1401685 RepID=W2UZL9_9RICK|nr:MAG: hypothetical protein P857_334 [Candidatus Xenolissoclinum pacificiensis L6]